MDEQNVKAIVSAKDITGCVSYVGSIDVKVSDAIIINVFEEKR